MVGILSMFALLIYCVLFACLLIQTFWLYKLLDSTVSSMRFLLIDECARPRIQSSFTMWYLLCSDRGKLPSDSDQGGEVIKTNASNRYIV